MTGYQVLGITDERTDCDNCGKRNLKATVALRTGANEVVYFGRDCAALATTGTKRNAKATEHLARAIRATQNALDAGATAVTAANFAWTRFGYATQASRDGAAVELFANGRLARIERHGVTWFSRTPTALVPA